MQNVSGRSIGDREFKTGTTISSRSWKLETMDRAITKCAQRRRTARNRQVRNSEPRRIITTYRSPDIRLPPRKSRTTINRSKLILSQIGRGAVYRGRTVCRTNCTDDSAILDQIFFVEIINFIAPRPRLIIIFLSTSTSIYLSVRSTRCRLLY